MQQHDEAQIRSFLRSHFAGLLPGETIEIRAFVPSGDLKRDWLATPEEAASWIKAEIPPTWDVYYGVNPRKWRGGGADAVSRILHLWADLDFKRFESEDEARYMVETFPLDPTTIVHTGGGLHLYWKLREPIDAATGGERVRGILRRVYRRLGGLDNVDDLPRVLRVPGTFNNKPGYGTPRPVFAVNADKE